MQNLQKFTISQHNKIPDGSNGTEGHKILPKRIYCLIFGHDQSNLLRPRQPLKVGTLTPDRNGQSAVVWGML
jgi:hypothetical protein